MTPEEQFTKIENLLESLTESQVQFQIELQQQNAQLAQRGVQIAEQGAQIDKQNAGIRDLIVVSRTVLEAQKEATKEIQVFREAQRESHREIDEKLKALIDIVDGIIRKNPGQ